MPGAWNVYVAMAGQCILSVCRTEENAKAACQLDANEACEDAGKEPTQLSWELLSCGTGGSWADLKFGRVKITYTVTPSQMND